MALSCARQVDRWPGPRGAICGAFYMFARRANGAERLSQDGALPAYGRRVLATAEFALEALAGCGQSPGCRLAHVYPISLRSARGVGPARALVRASVTQAETLLMRPSRRTQRRWGERRERIASAFEERRRELHAVSAEHKGTRTLWSALVLLCMRAMMTLAAAAKSFAVPGWNSPSNSPSD